MSILTNILRKLKKKDDGQIVAPLLTRTNPETNQIEYKLATDDFWTAEGDVK